MSDQSEKRFKRSIAGIKWIGEHSPTPWSVGTNEVLCIYARPDRVSQGVVIDFDSYDSIKDAKRIVECVNACEGIEEPDSTLTLVRETLASCRDGLRPDLALEVRRLCALLGVK